MMRTNAKQMRLGHKEWTIRPLTLGQVQAIEPVLLASDGAGTITTALAILRVALLRDFPADVPALEDIETDANEISVAMSTILQLGGFIREVQPGEVQPGEDRAGESPAQTGDGSTRA